MVHARIAIVVALLSAACSSGTTTGLGQDPDAGATSKGDSGSSTSIVPSAAADGGSTTTTPPTGSPSSCDIQTGSAACDGCMKQSCCTAIAACGASADCVALDDCLAKCPNGPSGQQCGDTCYQQHPEGATKADAIDSCATASCKTQCQ